MSTGYKVQRVHFYFHVAETELDEKTDMEVQIHFLVETGSSLGEKR